MSDSSNCQSQFLSSSIIPKLYQIINQSWCSDLSVFLDFLQSAGPGKLHTGIQLVHLIHSTQHYTYHVGWKRS